MNNMKNRNNIFADSEDKFVKNVLVYADADDGHLFYDSAKSIKIPKDELKDLFMKGMIIFLTDAYYIPVGYKESGSEASVNAYNDTASLTFYSAEHGE